MKSLTVCKPSSLLQNSLDCGQKGFVILSPGQAWGYNGATTLSITMLSIMTLDITSASIVILCMITLCTKTINIMTLSIPMFMIKTLSRVNVVTLSQCRYAEGR
jgi:hypothetical protein